MSKAQFNAALAPTRFDGTSFGKSFKKKQYTGLTKRRRLEEIGLVLFYCFGQNSGSKIFLYKAQDRIVEKFIFAPITSSHFL